MQHLAADKLVGQLVRESNPPKVACGAYSAERDGSSQTCTGFFRLRAGGFTRIAQDPCCVLGRFAALQLLALTLLLLRALDLALPRRFLALLPAEAGIAEVRGAVPIPVRYLDVLELDRLIAARADYRAHHMRLGMTELLLGAVGGTPLRVVEWGRPDSHWDPHGL